ncbi:hypothetical protein ACU686_35150 [Yinghuangia aomiensis]
MVAELGLAGHATWLTCRAGGAGADAALAAQAWDLSAVAPLHVDFLARFGGAVVPPAGEWSDEEAFVLRTRLSACVAVDVRA